MDGVLGNEILQDLTFRLNYSEKTLFIERLSQLGALGFPILQRRSNGQFFVNTALISSPIELVLDTHTGSTNLSSGTWALLTKRRAPAQVVEGIERAGNPTSPAITVCLPSIRIGAFALKEQAVRAQMRSESGFDRQWVHASQELAQELFRLGESGEVSGIWDECHTFDRRDDVMEIGSC